MIALLEEKAELIDTLCEKFFVANLFLFGSGASGKLNLESDLDFAVIFSDKLTPLEQGEAYFGLKEGLKNLVNREIDLISYRVVKNPIFKAELDRTKIELYAA